MKLKPDTDRRSSEPPPTRASGTSSTPRCEASIAARAFPNFENKHEIEQALWELGVPATFIRPTFFMENFTRFTIPTEEDGVLVLRMPMPGDVPLQMIAVTDVGAASVTALIDPSLVPDGAIELAGDELTGEHAANASGNGKACPPATKHSRQTFSTTTTRRCSNGSRHRRPTRPTSPPPAG